jgi:hypothetical protein
VRRYYASFTYQAQSWSKPRRVVAKAEWHPGELYPRVDFIVTNLARPAEWVVAFYNQRGTAEQWRFIIRVARPSNGSRKARRDQMDTPVMPRLGRQRCPSATPCAGLQPWQFHTNTGFFRRAWLSTPFFLHGYSVWKRPEGSGFFACSVPDDAG